MIPDTIMGAVLLSVIDMLLLLTFLYLMGLLFRLFPLFNKLHWPKRREKKKSVN